MPDSPSSFEWDLYPEAEAWLLDHLESWVAEVPAARALSESLLHRAGCRLADWLDHIILADGDRPRAQLGELGFEPEDVEAQPGDIVYHLPAAILPRIVLRAEVDGEPGTAIGGFIHVESIPAFLMANRRSANIEGTPRSPYRRATIWKQAHHELGVVERRGHSGFVPLQKPPEYPERYLRAFETWAGRPRLFEQVQIGMEQTLDLAQRLAAELGPDTAAWIILEVERAYWQQRNRAGQVQKARQDSLGLGWANHDHCAFRSSREAFTHLIQILKALGFRARERFYAGAEAGWGAQVMEQPACRLAIFCDVDLSPDEVSTDFSTHPLKPRQDLGTIGLWCALHGESMLGAGTHHLAARFDFDALAAGLAEWDVKLMRPFSDFPHLRQAFTRGERWSVSPERLDRLVATGQLTGEQRAQFAEKGALSSHMENIQRGQGFKGFNQRMVSDIIQRTDPRLAVGEA
jgi:hypothetical protein